MPATRPAAHLTRREVCSCLRWSRTTLWRRERAGLRFTAGRLPLESLRAWLASHGARPIPAKIPSSAAPGHV